MIRWMGDEMAIIGVIISVISLILTLYLAKTLREGVFNKLLSLKDEFETILDPLIKTNSKAMGAIGSLNRDTLQDQALERRIGKDLLGQNEDILEIIKMAFPSVSEYIEEHPEAITKLMPRLNTLLSDPETRKRLNLDSGQFRGKDLDAVWSNR